MKITQNPNKEEANYIKEKIKENDGYCHVNLKRMKIQNVSAKIS